MSLDKNDRRNITMKFVLNRNPENRNQKIPFPAMQMAGLADAKHLTIQADAGSILISREDITAQQAITMRKKLK